MHIAVTIATGH